MAEPTTRPRGPRRGALVLLGAVLLIAGGLLGAGRAVAWVGVPENGLPGMLSLRTLPGTPQWAAVVPGQVVHWRIAADLDVAVPASLSLELTAEGGLVTEAGLRIRVAGCEAEFVEVGNGWQCETGHEIVLEEATLATVATEEPIETWDLAPLAVGASRHLHVMLLIPEDAQVAGHSARVGIGVTAQGDDPASGGPAPGGPAPGAGPAVPALAATGLDWLMMGLLGAGVLLLGVGLRTGARTRSAS